ncbi:hypothetical protein CGLAMM_11515 [Acetobacteraceae bacterium EV16G]
MRGLIKQVMRCRCQSRFRTGAATNIIDEIPRSIGTITDESTACREIGGKCDGRDIDTVALEARDI